MNSKTETPAAVIFTATREEASANLPIVPGSNRAAEARQEAGATRPLEKYVWVVTADRFAAASTQGGEL